MTNTIDLGNALDSRGFAIWGAAAGDGIGWSVSGAGDVNNDDYGDIIIGAYRADPSSRSNAGISYVIYGGATNNTDIDLADIGSRGFVIWGAAANDQSGYSVSGAGDVNNDGYDDIIIGALTASPSLRNGAGTTYVIYGGTTNNTVLDLANMGTRGFEIWGAAAGDGSGLSVSGAGDVNNDGYGDIIVGAIGADRSSVLIAQYLSIFNAGISYVIFGSDSNPGTIDLANALDSRGFSILGAAAGDFSGQSVASAGDINNDGYGDIIIGADQADPDSMLNAGTSYVIFGGPTQFVPTSSNQNLTCGDEAGKVTWVDFNGDSKADFICERTSGKIEICLSTGSGVECIDRLTKEVANSTIVELMCKKNNQLGKITWVDFDGDSKADYICNLPDRTFEVCLSTGKSVEYLGELSYIPFNSTIV